MADPWNLTLDQSVFDDWSDESKLVINNQDLTDTYKLLDKLDKESVNQALIAQFENKLTICFEGDLDRKDVPCVLQMLQVVSQKLPLLSVPICQLTILTYKKVFHQVLDLNSLTDLKQYFECLGHCLHQVKTSGDFHTFITLLEVIEQAYRACSEKTFNLTEELFKHSSGMLMTALGIIEQQNFNQGATVTKLIITLVAIGKFSCRMDAKSMAFIWKLVLKTIQQNPEICSELELGAVVIFIIEEVFNAFDLIRQNTSSISKLAKVAGFLLKVIIGLIEREATLLENENENEITLRLIFQLLKFTPDVVKSELPLSDDLVRLLEAHVFITVHPILEHLIKTRRLLSSLIKESTNCLPENRMSFTRLLGMLLMPTYQSTIGENSSVTTTDLLMLFLSSVDQAHAEFNSSFLLHGIALSGQGVHTVPMYELLVTQACSGMAILTPASITQCVAILLQSAIQLGYWAHLMACDILIFLARYGTSQFCLELVQHVFLLSPSFPKTYSRTTYLINRLIRVLSTAGRASILKLYPLEKHPDIWATINWNSFSEEQRAAFERDLVPSVPSSQQLKAHVILRLHSICSSGNISIISNRNDLMPHLIKTGTLLLTALNNKSTKDYHRHMEYLLVDILRVLLCLAQPSQKEQHLHLIKVLKLALDAKALSSVQLDTAQFLSKIGPSGVAASPQQPALLRVIANMFCETIATRSFLVQICAFHAFEVFFKTTPHSQLASSCVREGQDQAVKQFINRQTTKSSADQGSNNFSLQAAILANPPINLNPLPKLAIEAYAFPSIESLGANENYTNGTTAKRPRLENDEQLQFLLSNLDKVVNDIGQLCPLPPWSKEEIKERIHLLNSFL